jgi:hypothetical protein
MRPSRTETASVCRGHPKEATARPRDRADRTLRIDRRLDVDESIHGKRPIEIVQSRNKPTLNREIELLKPPGSLRRSEGSSVTTLGIRRSVTSCGEACPNCRAPRLPTGPEHGGNQRWKRRIRDTSREITWRAADGRRTLGAAHSRLSSRPDTFLLGRSSASLMHTNVA